MLATDCLPSLEELLGESKVLTTLLGSSTSFPSRPIFPDLIKTRLISLSGSSLISTTYHSLFPSSTSLPVIPSSHVSASSGTGLVHCAPSHGAEDYVAHRLYFPELDLLCPVDDDGKFTAEVGERFVGKSVLGDGAKDVVSWLREKDDGRTLLGVKTITHKYPYDWKTKEPVITR